MEVNRVILKHHSAPGFKDDLRRENKVPQEECKVRSVTDTKWVKDTHTICRCEQWTARASTTVRLDDFTANSWNEPRQS